MSKRKRLKILVTAGPTQEMIDPVRFISNRSSGVMGYEIARAAKRRGHAVTLISGPTALRPPKGAKLLRIRTVSDLKRATLSRLRHSDCLFMVAAVSDWRIPKFCRTKIKRAKRTLRLLLEPTPDILALAGRKKGKTILVGFSLETKADLDASRGKIKKKNLDLIVANSFNGAKDPFGNKKVKSFIVHRSGEVERLPFLSKGKIASLLVDKVEKLVG